MLLGIHQGVRLRYPPTACTWSSVGSRCRAVYLCNVEAPNSKATHESTCTYALAKLCAKTILAINLRALQLALNSALLIQLPSTGNPSHHLAKAPVMKARVDAWGRNCTTSSQAKV